MNFADFHGFFINLCEFVKSVAELLTNSKLKYFIVCHIKKNSRDFENEINTQ